MSCRSPAGRAPRTTCGAGRSRHRRHLRVPDDRGWDTDGALRPDPERPAQLHQRRRVPPRRRRVRRRVLRHPPREALAMDPQQRLLLEAAWEALERAGIDPTRSRQPHRGVRRRRSHDYSDLLQRAAAGARGLPRHRQRRRASPPDGSPTPSGCEGPAITVDTACSSSLVALHLACQALRRRRVHAGPRRRGRRCVDPRRVRRVQPAARPRRRTAGARRSRPPRTAPVGARA